MHKSSAEARRSRSPPEIDERSGISLTEREGIIVDSDSSDEAEREWHVKAIVNDRKINAEQQQYLVQWKSYLDEEATWEPAVLVEDTAALDAYLAAKKQKRKRNKNVQAIALSIDNPLPELSAYLSFRRRQELSGFINNIGRASITAFLRHEIASSEGCRDRVRHCTRKDLVGKCSVCFGSRTLSHYATNLGPMGIECAAKVKALKKFCQAVHSQASLGVTESLFTDVVNTFWTQGKHRDNRR